MILSGYKYGGAVLGLFVLMVLFRWFVHKEGIKSFLIHFDSRGIRLLLKGLLIGVAVSVFYILVTVVTKQGEVTINPDALWNTVRILLVALFMFSAVALFEEALYRGYIMQKLKDKYSIAIAILVPSVLFGLWHFIAYSNDQYFAIGLFNALLYALIMSLLTIKYKSIMMSIGFHLTWDVVQALIFSTTNLKMESIIRFNISEGYLAGANSNPETGIILTLILGVWLIYSYWMYKKEKNIDCM